MSRGIGQRNLERLAGVGVNTLSQWENGGGATLSKVRKIAHALGFTITLTRFGDALLPPKKLSPEHKRALHEGRDEHARLNQMRDKCERGHDLTNEDAVFYDPSGGVRCVQCRNSRSRAAMKRKRRVETVIFPLIPRPAGAIPTVETNPVRSDLAVIKAKRKVRKPRKDKRWRVKVFAPRRPQRLPAQGLPPRG